MQRPAADTRKITNYPSGIGRFHSMDEAGGSVGASVGNLLKALMGSAFSNKRKFFR
jgi:hypothetical protein